MKNSPIDILITRNRQTQFWFLLFLLSIIGFTWERSRLTAALNQDMRFVVMDENSFYLPRSMDFESAIDLHTGQVTIALETLFNRNPKSIDNPNRLQRLFSRKSMKKANKLISEEAQSFTLKQIHQKVEIGDIKLLQTTDETVMATAEGQLIRNGIFDGEGFTEVHRLNARLQFTRNDNLLINGGFPTIVTSFEISTTPSSL